MCGPARVVMGRSVSALKGEPPPTRKDQDQDPRPRPEPRPRPDPEPEPEPEGKHELRDAARAQRHGGG